MNHLKTNYVSPECETYVLAAEGVLCASGEMWYEQGGAEVLTMASMITMISDGNWRARS
ncbi:MAG: hypothetical protein IJ504_08860 [Bacteroidales bacterium]|nr:hypothetical protein [Bacteroidales bacterium]